MNHKATATAKDTMLTNGFTVGPMCHSHLLATTIKEKFRVSVAHSLSVKKPFLWFNGSFTPEIYYTIAIAIVIFFYRANRNRNHKHVCPTHS